MKLIVQIAIEEERNSVDVAEVCVSVDIYVWYLLVRKRNQVIETWREKDTEKVKKSDVDIWKDLIAIAVKNKCKRTEVNIITCQ